MTVPIPDSAGSTAKPRLILVEGMPGTGKSSVSQMIYRDLGREGQPATWLHEESDHPLRLYFAPDRHENSSAYLTDVTDRWKAFADQVARSRHVFVIDSGVLQNHVRSLLIFDADRNAVYTLVKSIEQIIVPLAPKWIQLDPLNIESHFESVVAVRGHRMRQLWVAAHDQYPYTINAGLCGESGFLAFWREFDAIAREVFNDLSLSKLPVEVGPNSRRAGDRRIRNDLGLTEVTVPVSPERLIGLCGDYAPHGNADHATVRIAVEGGCLVAVADNPTIDVKPGPLGCFRRVRFIPHDPKRFYVEGWPHDVCFEQTPDGKMFLKVYSTPAAWQQSSETFVRLQ